MEYYALVGDQQEGPLSADEVRRKLRDGELRADHLGWHEGLTDWKPLAQILPVEMAMQSSPQMEPPPMPTLPVQAPPMPTQQEEQAHSEAGKTRRLVFKVFGGCLALFFAFGSLLIVLAVIGHFLPRTRVSPASEQSSGSTAGESGEKKHAGPLRWITKEDGHHLASTSRSQLEKAISYAVQNDTEALNDSMRSGDVFLLKGGMEVEIVGSPFLAGIVKVRLIGTREEFWTDFAALRK